MRQRKGFFYDSLKLISAKRIFVVQGNYWARQISFTKFNFHENLFVCGSIFTDFYR